VQTSGRSFVARELIEPFSREKANEATWCAMRSLPLWVLAINVHRKGGWVTNDRVNRQLWLALEGLELCEVKVSCTVLRGLGVSNDPRLPDLIVFLHCSGIKYTIRLPLYCMTNDLIWN
jgi:hypothetical protein